METLTWLTSERAGLEESEAYRQRLISVPLDPENESAGNFDVYYFVPLTSPERKKLPAKSLLFCAGGPGRTLKPNDSLWFRSLSDLGYNIVFFHLRGCGFSQIPESNEYDRFLRTKYAVNDMEKIRADFLGEHKKWDGIVGYSYGALLAQQYAKTYSQKVEKLVLIGPISLGDFAPPSDPIKSYEHYAKDLYRIRRETITKIYDLEELKVCYGDAAKQNIVHELFGKDDTQSEHSERQSLGIYQMIDKYFGYEQYILENYGELTDPKEKILSQYGLNYGRGFLESLSKLRKWGWQPLLAPDNVRESLVRSGKIIAQELGIDVGVEEPVQREMIERNKSNVPRSLRAFEIMGVYDGINRRFVKEFFANPSRTVADFRDAIAKSVGDAQSKYAVNKRIEKIGVVENDIKSLQPWTPGKFRHKVPTLILNGGGDPVTAGAQAEKFLDEGFDSPEAVLLEFEGVGHEFTLPPISMESSIVNEVFRGEFVEPLDCIVSAFIEKNFYEFIKIAKEVALGLKQKQIGVVGDTPGS